MNVLMMSNTYKPFVGGVERSIEGFARELRARGHEVLIVAPDFPDQPEHENDVVRVPAIQRFNGTDFSVQLPVPGILSSRLDKFKPDLVHSHHPYLVGDTALRVGRRRGVPVVFTFHTFFERYTHYVPGDSPALKRFVVSLSVGYSNLCDHVIAPSHAVESTLKSRGVRVPVSVIPTGIDLDRFSAGKGTRFRAALGIPEDAFTAGTVSRIAPEKNPEFLAKAGVRLLRREPDAHFVVVGQGPSLDTVRERFDKAGLGERFHATGTLQGEDLADAYGAFDVFVFASETETQGLVVAEAMAAGTPVVAVSAGGINDVVVDGENGFLVSSGDMGAFVRAVRKIKRMTPEERRSVAGAARETAGGYSRSACVRRLAALYEDVLGRGRKEEPLEGSAWREALRLAKAEFDLIGTKADAAGAAFRQKSRREKHHAKP